MIMVFDLNLYFQRYIVKIVIFRRKHQKIAYNIAPCCLSCQFWCFNHHVSPALYTGFNA